MYFYFGTDNFIILGLFILASAFSLLTMVGVFALCVKIFLALKYIRGYIKRRGEK